MLKLKAPGGNNQIAGTLPFEPMADEPQDAYRQFASFLASDPDYTPARWIVSRDLDFDTWIAIAGRYNWISRRVDYWQYLAIQQRARWVKMLESYGEAVLERKEHHLKRIQWAQEKEIEEEKSGAEFGRAMRDFNADIATITQVINTLNGSTRDSITIVNQQVGNINLTKDISEIAKAWDDASRSVVEGTARQVDRGSETSE